MGNKYIVWDAVQIFPETELAFESKNAQIKISLTMQMGCFTCTKFVQKETKFKQFYYDLPIFLSNYV
jgi:hypothetical protein